MLLSKNSFHNANQINITQTLRLRALADAGSEQVPVTRVPESRGPPRALACLLSLLLCGGTTFSGLFLEAHVTVLWGLEVPPPPPPQATTPLLSVWGFAFPKAP